MHKGATGDAWNVPGLAREDESGQKKEGVGGRNHAVMNPGVGGGPAWLRARPGTRLQNHDEESRRERVNGMEGGGRGMTGKKSRVEMGRAEGNLARRLRDKVKGKTGVRGKWKFRDATGCYPRHVS